MTFQVSLCIPTMRRFNFLKENLPKYLTNPYIKEIVIVDETGEDYELLSQVYKTEPKLRLFKNEVRLGTFLNKIETAKKASCEWICLIDSDNFADLDYFEQFIQYTLGNPDKDIVYCPSFAKPRFDYRPIQNIIMDKSSMSSNIAKYNRNHIFITAFNTGNYIYHKSVLDTIDMLIKSDDEVNRISKTVSGCDVIYLNYLLLKNKYKFVFVPKMEYTHVVHNDSIYLLTHESQRDLNDYINNTLFLRL